MSQQEGKEQKDKKIKVDEDWKQQAQREKEVLAAQERAERKKAKAAKQRRSLPPADFAGLVGMLATQAMLALGALVPEGQEKVESDLEAARYNIDMLQMLETKTQGNLSEQESALLTDTLHQVRMLYVRVAG
jgi:hypothetical protein